MSNVKTDPSKVISTFDMDQSAPLGRAPKHLLFTDVCMVGWGKCVPPPPHHTNVCKISRLWGATSLLVFNKSLSNFTDL